MDVFIEVGVVFDVMFSEVAFIFCFELAAPFQTFRFIPVFFFPAEASWVNFRVFGAVDVDTSFAIFIFNGSFVPLSIFAVVLVAGIFGD